MLGAIHAERRLGFNQKRGTLTRAKRACDLRIRREYLRQKEGIDQMRSP
jgi:hypothetical protein